MRKQVKSAGFTLIEMLVVMGVMVLITALVLANNNRFGGVVLLQNLAYDIALSIRQAQVFGISVQRFNTTFEAPYGVHFQVDASGESDYVLFADVDEDGYYDAPGELVQTTSVASGYAISQLCATTASGTERCDITSLDITFRRPEPDAYIQSSSVAEAVEKGKIRVTSSRGDHKYIAVFVNGQISVE